MKRGESRVLSGIFYPSTQRARIQVTASPINAKGHRRASGVRTYVPITSPGKKYVLNVCKFLLSRHSLPRYNMATNNLKITESMPTPVRSRCRYRSIWASRLHFDVRTLGSTCNRSIPETYRNVHETKYKWREGTRDSAFTRSTGLMKTWWGGQKMSGHLQWKGLMNAAVKTTAGIGASTESWFYLF